MRLDIHHDGYRIKTIDTPAETEAAYRLRHEVFAEELKWVPEREDRREVDGYDACSEGLGVFTAKGFIGYMRLIRHTERYMIEREFSCMLPHGMTITKTADSAEVTRFCVQKEYRSIADINVPLLLYKGLYHWNIYNDIRYSWMVVDKRFYRLLCLTGLPTEAVAPFVIMPDGVQAAVCLLDWKRFETEAYEKKRELLEWMQEGLKPVLKQVSAP
ncbi:MAG: GNAT family N-acetyltransferase [Deltaproteobacteria bacterium]|nr:GNAT family N-acetyltransferase [Deltaproteobacteria bacterium]